MAIELNDEIRRLLDGRHFAVLATINPDGSPQTSAMWVGRDGDDVLFSTVAGRRKHRNLEREPRASVTVLDSGDPYNYVELRGRVTIEEDIGRAFDTGLSRRYDGRDRPGSVGRGQADPADFGPQGDGLRRLRRTTRATAGGGASSGLSGLTSASRPRPRPRERRRP